ncbi:helix-turn-helix domain-containing protein [Aldersonia kunmingensis]|uniref:helix-turn-helix domain-containing protein n=1 Tax=Aldersonia kunmingensis TaxID=408066 RepID=UPI000A0565B1|nr:helix-turn-helix domain-containing protein [Aldersonia kunmingensis]
MNGLAPDTVPDILVDEDFGNCDLVLRAARPVLDAASDHLADTGMALLLTDAESRIIAGVYGGMQVENHIGHAGAVRGSTMAEDSVGTTALGTPVETRSAIEINGAEHYLDLYKHLSCYGRPIVHPTTRRLEGVLCMTEISPAANPLFRSYVGRLVSDIQARLLDTARSSHRAILDTFHHACARRSEAVVAIGDDLLLTNDMATNLLDSSDIGALRAFAAGSAPATMLTASGVSLSLSGTRVDGVPRAAVFVLRPEMTERRRVPRGEVVDRTASELFAAPSFSPGQAPDCRSISISGEPGTGRTTYAKRAVTGIPVHALDAVRLAASGDTPDLATRVAAARADNAALVIDGVDLLTDRDLTLIRRIVTDRTVPIVLVGEPAADQRPAVAAVTALCDEQVDLPALRHRTQHIAALSAFFAEQRRPGSTCSAAVVDALMAQHWPANLSEFRRVLERAGESVDARGSVGRIELDDLPEPYRRSSKASTLSIRERTERQAIVDALAACRGNKVHAATHLGISRSTLYARIRALDIDT